MREAARPWGLGLLISTLIWTLLLAAPPPAAAEAPGLLRVLDARAGRTCTAATSNPKSFALSPGRYRVTLTAVRLPGKPTPSLEVAVEAGGTTEVTAEFGGG
jgi:hypothetical protein